MKKHFRKSILAATITSVMALPVWAGSDTTVSTEQTDPDRTSATAQPRDEVVEKQSAPETGDSQVSAVGAQVLTPDPMMSVTPDDLYQRDVIGSTGEKIGHVSDVVSHRETGEIRAVISSGGFFGIIGGTKHAIPLSELRFEDKQLHLDSTRDALSQRARYQDEQYTLVQPHDRPISEFSAFEPTK